MLRRAIRSSDIVARIGGDEFAILLRHLSESSAHRRAMDIERIVAATEIPSLTGPVFVGASAGVAMVVASDCPDDLMARADMKMYGRKLQRASEERRLQNVAA